MGCRICTGSNYIMILKNTGLCSMGCSDAEKEANKAREANRDDARRRRRDSRKLAAKS
jgi:hypothetical protein